MSKPKLSEHLADDVKHITSTERNNWNENITKFTNSIQHTTLKTNKDANGIYTTVTLKRSDGTLYMTSVLSGGTSPNYTTRTETYYKIDGTTIDVTKTYTRTYDSDEDLLSEVMS